MSVVVTHIGHVRRADGGGPEGTIVEVVKGTAPTPEIGIVCDAAGNFRIALPPGIYEIRARSPDGAQGSVVKKTGEDAEMIELTLTHGG